MFFKFITKVDIFCQVNLTLIIHSLSISSGFALHVYMYKFRIIPALLLRRTKICQKIFFFSSLITKGQKRQTRKKKFYIKTYDDDGVGNRKQLKMQSPLQSSFLLCISRVQNTKKCIYREKINESENTLDRKSVK